MHDGTDAGTCHTARLRLRAVAWPEARRRRAAKLVVCLPACWSVRGRRRGRGWRGVGRLAASRRPRTSSTLRPRSHRPAAARTRAVPPDTSSSTRTPRSASPTSLSPPLTILRPTSVSLHHLSSRGGASTPLPRQETTSVPLSLPFPTPRAVD